MAQKIVNGEIVDDVEEEIEDDQTDDVNVDPESADTDTGDDDNPGANVEPWQQADDDAADDDLGVMPVAAHVRYKHKSKERLTEREQEIERLRQENEALKSGKFKPDGVPERPRREDFDDDDAYAEAFDIYQDKMTDLRLKRAEFSKTQTQQQQHYLETTRRAVDAHYERAAKVVKDTGIKPEVYKKTDELVRTAVDAVMPGVGDAVVDQAITILGDGSEKVMYYLGRNAPALDKFKSLLAEDRTGMRAMVFLGQQKERLIGSKARRSSAPAPAPNPGGGSPNRESANVRKLRKTYTEAHKRGNAQAAFDAKRAAKQAGIDVSEW